VMPAVLQLTDKKIPEALLYYINWAP